MDQVNYYLNMDRGELVAERCQNIESIGIWTDLFDDDGEMLLAKASLYRNYVDFEKAYYTEYSCSPLHHAVKSNKTLISRKILLKGADVNILDNLLLSPLYYSISMDNFEMVELLLNHGAAAKGTFIENDSEITYFERVCQSSHWRIVELFISHGCDANEIFTNDSWRCPRFSRPLHVAVSNKKLDTIKILLTYHADVNDMNEDGETPLYLACAENYVEAVELLLDKNALVNVSTKHNKTPLHQGIKYGNERIVELLLMNGAFIENDNTDVFKNICDPLHFAISQGFLKIVEDLLSHGLDVNMKFGSSKNGEDPAFLHTAVEHEQIEIINMLLRYNAEVDIRDEVGRTPLHVAAEKENLIISELLLHYDKKLEVSPLVSTLNAFDKKGNTPLHLACTGTSSDCVLYFLQSGADINVENYEGATPLHFACEIGDIDIVNLLIKNNALINASTEDNSTPLHIAVRNSHTKIVELLLLNGASTIIQDSYGRIPLELIVHIPDMKIIELLLQYNPDVNNIYYRKIFLKVLSSPKALGNEIINSLFKYGFVMEEEDKNNIDILYQAVSNGYYHIVEQLVNEHMDLDFLNEGETLLHSATKNQHHEIIELLIKNKASVHMEDQYGKIPICYAIEVMDKAIIETFLTHGVNVKMYPALLHHAVVNSNYKCIEVLDLLINYGTDINYQNVDGANALHLIIMHFDKNFVKKPTLSNIPGEPIIQNFEIISYPVLEIVVFLLEKGINVNAKTRTGWTALNMAVRRDNKLGRLVETLLQHDADVNCTNASGSTPLHLACAKGYFTIISILLNFGADVNIKDLPGRTPLDVVFKLKYIYHKNAQRNMGMGLFNSIQHLNSYFQMRRYNEFSYYAVLVLKNHIIKLIAANFYLCPNNVKYLEDKQNYQAKCEEEIKNVKDLKLNNYVSAYDVLARELTEVARYTKNENIQAIQKALENEEKFPVYGTLIVERLKKAIRRYSYLDRAKESLNHLSGFGLPDACTENIIIFLGNQDLKNLSSIDFPLIQNMEIEVSD